MSFTYTDFSAVLKRTDARGVETHYKYDSPNRLSQVWYTGLGGDDAGNVRPALPTGVAPTSDVMFRRSILRLLWGRSPDVRYPIHYG
jgi:hypothetical protein